ncbi:Dot/Icm T4SS effector LegP [Spirosoma luteolum]
MNARLLITTASVVSLMMSACTTEWYDHGEGADPIAQKQTVTKAEEAFPGQKGVLKTAYLDGQPIQYQEVGGENVLDSDMLLMSSQLQSDPDIIVQGTGRSRTSSRWPGKVVYYTIDPALPAINQDRVKNAIAHWQANTPMRFVLRTNQAGYVVFRAGSGCSANVGYSGTVQYVNLATGCSLGNTIHEIGHTIGLYHEHTRADRNSYVTVNMNNVTSGYEINFQTYVERKIDGFDYQGGLDFNSIMLYSSYDFSANGLPTLTKKDGSTFVAQRTALSAADINTVKYMYP